MKVLWPRLVAAGTPARTAYRAESLIQQVLLLIAPLLATMLMVLAGPAAAVWTAAAATLSGSIAFVYHAARIDAGAADRPHHTGSALRAPRLRVLIAATAVQGLVFGAMPVVLPGLATHAGAPDMGGLLLAAWICGGVLGSLRRAEADFPLALARLATALAVPTLIAAVTDGSLVATAAAFSFAGLFLTPVAAASYVLVNDTTPSANRTEAFTWLSTALAVGGAAGSALAGATVDRLGILPAASLPLTAAATATAIAARLRTRTRPSR
ncbi:hypothetical protein Cs7R123_06000 [Catellatospora sp. TT07R-123]|uniref:hypothetical protein n=1 Tax=Catellatospora sp. TT07R-123 TaxID=2733863 RepID=UPI001B0C7007|nr:hypothetical protein [Catellatospora sp. TT07R-123]GHJ43258.1 hypothetical protein Cs7R123_06000 [Catellatospora sp. TT07R-123]